MKKEHWADVMMATYCSGMVVVAVSGIVEIAPAWPGIGPPIAYLYGLVLAMAGIGGVVGIVTRNRKVTVWGIYVMAISTLGHAGLMAFLEEWMATIRLLISPLMMIPAAMGWRYWMEATEHPRKRGD